VQVEQEELFSEIWILAKDASQSTTLHVVDEDSGAG
jgi:hypothetical protein